MQIRRPNSWMNRRVLLAAGAGLLATRGAFAADQPVTVAAASDLQAVLGILAQAFEAETGFVVRPTFGSSGNFARQLRQGAPFDLFMSADEELVMALARDGHVRDAGVVYAEGRLSLMVHTSSPLAARPSVAAFVEAVKASRIKRVAIANPEHAPYGQRALDVLNQLRLMDFIRPKLVYGENVAQAVQFIATGAAEAGLVAHALTLAEAIKAVTRSVDIPPSWHRPLLQRMALTPRAEAGAQRFYNYLRSPVASKTFRAYGFAVPGI
jgi:molybdate transport system substrate-binding protein